MTCPVCGGDGIERCDNPDHGFIESFGDSDMGRIGCPVCGHDPQRRVMGCKCPECNGSGLVKDSEE